LEVRAWRRLLRLEERARKEAHDFARAMHERAEKGSV
jgi:hypothetical protein